MARSFALQSPYNPTTFLERGVAVGFTSPALAGARVRISERGGLELIVANPAGGRGFYVLPWAGVREFCSSTLHDRRLQERAAALTCVTPRSIRQIAREVAGKGYAGREARAAAAQSREQEQQALILTNYLLLMNLVAQIESRDPVVDGEHSPLPEHRARRAVARLAPRLGTTPEAIAAALENLADLFAGVGIGSCATTSVQARLLARVTKLRADMNHWATSHFGESAGLAEVICITAELTISCANLAVTEIRALTENMVDLLSRWRTAPEVIVSRLTRPEWLLDGWEPICALWEDTANTQAAKHATIGEMAQYIPVLPKEVGEWFGTAVKAEVMNVFRRWTELNRDWRTGLPFIDLVARNEHLRSLAL